jgi:hypothetical protein
MNTDIFDFDEWATLAKFAPDEFERRRIEYVEQLISKYGNTPRLRGLQCSIDMERIRARTALKSCLRSAGLRLNVKLAQRFVCPLWVKQLAIRLGCKQPQPSRWLSLRGRDREGEAGVASFIIRGGTRHAR